MKNITRMASAVVKRSFLLVVGLMSLIQLEAKQDKQQKPKAVKSAKHVKPQPRGRTVQRNSRVAAQVVESDTHNVVVKERPFNAAKPEESSVDVKTEQLADGSFKEVQTTIEVKPIEGKVVETTETWTWYDVAKVAAIGAGVVGAAALGYTYQNEIGNAAQTGFNKASQYADSANQGMRNWWNGQQNEILTQAAEVISTDAQVAQDAAQANVDAATQNAVEQGNDPETDSGVQAALALQ